MPEQDRKQLLMENKKRFMEGERIGHMEDLLVSTILDPCCFCCSCTHSTKEEVAYYLVSSFQEPRRDPIGRRGVWDGTIHFTITPVGGGQVSCVTSTTFAEEWEGHYPPRLVEDSFQPVPPPCKNGKAISCHACILCRSRAFVFSNRQDAWWTK